MGYTQEEVAFMVFAIVGAVIAVGTMVLLCTRDRACLPSERRPRRRAFPPEDDIELQTLPPHGRESFEQIGELHIPPGRQPTHMALDIITRFLMALGCPSRATFATEPASTGHGRTDSVHANTPDDNADLAPSQPRDEFEEIDLTSSQPTPLPAELSLPAMTNAQASVAAKSMEGNFLQSMRKARGFLSQLPSMIDPWKDAQKPEDANEKANGKGKAPRRMKDSSENKVADDILLGVFVIEDDEDELEETAPSMEVAVDPMSGTYGRGKSMAALYPRVK
ncbi:hypothetical protein IQ07DRAFT_646361 [Pyrenochaeta sp. DS3sAY3a]|nr:hypothetical protein IQ07DRAFT_646361 [Pyrenochaeta sp. DS3sAY3a]